MALVFGSDGLEQGWCERMDRLASGSLVEWLATRVSGKPVVLVVWEGNVGVIVKIGLLIEHAEY